MERRITKYEHTNHCPDCAVFVDDCLAHCPLCGKELTSNPLINPLYPKLQKQHYIDRRSFTTELFLFLTLLFVGGSIVLNLIFWSGTSWFLAVAAPVLYAWILVANTLISDTHPGGKCFLQLLGVMAMMLAFDYVAGWLGWSYKYVLPALLVAALIYIDIYSWIHKSRWRDNLFYAILFVALACIPLITYFTGLITNPWPAIMCAIVGGLTILNLLKFSVKYIAGEMKRRFHM